MKIISEYSHLGGKEILMVNYPHILEEVYNIISNIIPKKTKLSLEKTKINKWLVSPIEMNKDFKEQFQKKGYKELREKYSIEYPTLEKPIFAYKQVDFVKGDIFIEVQFGKYPFMFYDLFKFQYFYYENKAKVGIEIVPSYSLHRSMSSGVSYGEQLVFDLTRLKKSLPSVPVLVIMIDEDK